MMTLTTSESYPSPRQLAFMRLAASDDRLRSELCADPRKVLSRYGLSVDPELVPASVLLPEREQIEQALACFADDEGIGAPEIGPLDENWTGFLGGGCC